MNKAHLTVAFLLLQLVCVSFGGPVIETTTKVTPSKRSLIGFDGFEEGGGGGWPNEWNQFNGNPWGGQNIHQAWSPHKPVPSQMEVSSVIAAAKQASENVLIAQQQMIAAKENVLQQQRLASEREANAQIAQQKLESVAAIQRSEASAAAQGIILAQQRLAATKNALAHHQKIASVKEATAADFLKRAAHAASIEIQRTEHEAEKLSTLHRNGAAASSHHVAATKDALAFGIHQGGGGGPGAFSLGPWSTIAPTPGMTHASFINPLGPHQGQPGGLYNPRNAPLLWG